MNILSNLISMLVTITTFVYEVAKGCFQIMMTFHCELFLPALLLYCLQFCKKIYQITFESNLKNINPWGMTGKELVYKMLEKYKMKNIQVVVSENIYNNCYSSYSRSKSIILGNEVFFGNSITAAAIAAHEAGHSMQDRKKNLLFFVRNLICKSAEPFKYWPVPLFILAMVYGNPTLINIAKYAIEIVLLASLLNIIVEADATAKGIKYLSEISDTDKKKKSIEQVRKVLWAALGTYFVGTFIAISAVIWANIIIKIF